VFKLSCIICSKIYIELCVCERDREREREEEIANRKRIETDAQLMGYQVLFSIKINTLSRLWISRTLIHTLPARRVCVCVCVCVRVCVLCLCNESLCSRPAGTQRSESRCDARPGVYIWWVKSATVMHSASEFTTGTSHRASRPFVRRKKTCSKKRKALYPTRGGWVGGIRTTTYIKWFPTICRV